MRADEIKAELIKLQALEGELDPIAEFYQAAKLNLDSLGVDDFKKLDQKLKDTALMVAALKGDETGVRFCVANGASLYAHHNTRPILHAVAWSGNLKMLQVLLDIDPKVVNITDALGMNALQLLIDESAQNASQKTQRTQIATFLIERGILGSHRDRKSKEGFDALYYAAKNGYTQVALALIEQKSWLNVAYPDKTNVLYWAFENNDTELKNALLENKDFDFGTALSNVNAYRKSIQNQDDRTSVVNLMVAMIAACPLKKVKGLEVLKDSNRPEIKKALKDYNYDLGPKPTAVKLMKASTVEKGIGRLPPGYTIPAENNQGVQNKQSKF